MIRTRFTINEILFVIIIACYTIYTFAYNTIGYWIPRYVFYTFVSSMPAWGNMLKQVAALLMLALAIKCFAENNMGFPRFICLMDMVLIFYFAVWLAISALEYSLSQALWGQAAVLVVLIPLLKYIGADKDLWRMMQYILPLFTWIFTAAALWSAWFYIAKYGIFEAGNAPHKNYFCLAITCAWPYCLSMSYKERTKRIELFSIQTLLIIAALMTRSRAWILQTLMLFLICLLASNRDKRVKRWIVAIMAVVVLAFAVLYAFPTLTEELLGRGFEDTRSNQYVLFLEQHTLADLILGGGVDAHYLYLGDPHYIFFDNQFIFVMFHYGLFPTLCILITFIGIWMLPVNSIDPSDRKAAKVMVVFLVAAYTGLSVYYQIGWGLLSLIPLVYMGHVFSQTWQEQS